VLLGKGGTNGGFEMLSCLWVFEGFCGDECDELLRTDDISVSEKQSGRFREEGLTSIEVEGMRIEECSYGILIRIKRIKKLLNQNLD
jgi:hypothetical protein